MRPRTRLVGLVTGCLLPAGSLLAPAGAAAACSPPSDAYGQAVLADAPSAYYRLDEAGGATMCDASSAATDGTYAAGVQYGVAGALGSTPDTAVAAADPSSGIGTGGPGVTGAHSFTLEGWFRSGGTIQNQALVAMGTAAQGQIAGLTTWSNVGTTSYGTDVGTKGASEIGLDTYSSSNHWDTSPVGVDIWDGRWHHLAVTYDQSANQVAAYADGKALPSETPSTTLNLGAGPIRLGGWVDQDLNKPLSGSEDEAAVYPTALSADRIAAHYQAAAAPGPGPGPTPGGKRATGLLVSCSYSYATSADTCTALVGDASANATKIAPTGSVTFASPHGLFTLGSTCSLSTSATTPSIAGCSVDYLPPDEYLPTITATYNGDAQHGPSTGHTQYRGASGASTYETVASPDPGAVPRTIGVSVPVAVAGTAVDVCAISAVSGAYAAANERIPIGKVLSVPELQGLTKQLDDVVGKVLLASSATLQRSGESLMKAVLEGFSPDPEERAGILRLPFMNGFSEDLGKLMEEGLAPLQPSLQELSNLFVGDVMDSIPTDPQKRADDLSQAATQRLLDDVGQILKAQEGRCSAPAASQRTVGHAKPRRRVWGKPLGRVIRHHVQAGRLELKLHLDRRRMARLAKHRNSVRVAVIVNLRMPSATLRKGYPRSVVELVRLRRGRRHKP